MDLSMERDCSALGSLFQQIINDMKNSSPLWEDFLAKAGKLHACLRAAIQAIAAYLDAFQKIADAATNSRGASKEIGTALTRVCLRHKAVETRLKTFTTAIMDCLVQPLQEKLEDWKRSVATIDKEHAKEYKRCRTELKKRSNDTLRLQKKARKGQADTIQTLMDSHMQDVTLRRAELEDVEKKSLRIAMIEERLRYCTFVDMLQPVVREECEVMSELGHLQEAMESIALVTKDPNILPAASEELIQDAKASICLYPESPGGSQSGSAGAAGTLGNNLTGPANNSLGSRKSSVCSISSINSSGSSNSPGHQYQRSLSQFVAPALRLKSGESSDSGFCSSPALTIQGPAVANQTHAVATWPTHSQDVDALPPNAERPHTISSTYEKGHQRPPLTVYTFQNPETIYEANNAGTTEGTYAAVSDQNNSATNKSSSNSRPPLPVRCSSLERPLSANSNNRTGANLMQRQCPSPIPAHITKELSAQFAHQQHQQQQQQMLQQQQQSSSAPTYANMSDLNNMAAAKNMCNLQQQQQQVPQKQNSLQQQQSIDSISSQLSNDSNASASITTAAQQLQNNINKPRSHSISSSVSSNTASLHSHPSIESTMATASLMGQTPSSGSSTPQNHYSPLLTNSPSSTAAGTPSGASITSSSGPTGIANFLYNVDSPTPSSASYNNQQQVDNGSIGSGGNEILKITENTTNPTSTPPTNDKTINKPLLNNSSSDQANSSNSIVDTDSPTIVENDERSRASVLQKASMFEKQAAAAASILPSSSNSTIVSRASAESSAMYGTRSSGNSVNSANPIQQMDQNEMDKSFEDSIQELNNLLGELDLFQREIDASKQQQEQQQGLESSKQQQQQEGEQPGDNCNTTFSFMKKGPGGGNGACEFTSTTTTTTTTSNLLEAKQKQFCSSSIQTNSSGCGTDISDTTSDDIVADENQSNTKNNNHPGNSSLLFNDNISNNLKIYATADGGSNYNSDSELSRCYVSETSSLAGGLGGNGGYENPTFAHFASTSNTVATVAASSVTSSEFGLSNFDDSFGDSRSLIACSDSISHNSETLSIPRHAYVDSDNGSAVVVIYDHQIPITPDIDYVKQNSEIVVLRTKSPQQLQMHEMQELQELPANLIATPDSPETPPHPALIKKPLTATVAPAKQRLSSFRASSDQQLQLFGCSSGNSSPLHMPKPNNYSTHLRPDKGMNNTSPTSNSTTSSTSTTSSPTSNNSKALKDLFLMNKEIPTLEATPPTPPMIPMIPTSSISVAQNHDTILRRRLPPKPNLSIFQQNAKNLEINNNNNHNNNHNSNHISSNNSQSQISDFQQISDNKSQQNSPTQQQQLKTNLNNNKIIDFKADLDEKIRQQKLKILQKQQQQQQQQQLQQHQQPEQEQNIQMNQDHLDILNTKQTKTISQQSLSNHCNSNSNNVLQQKQPQQQPQHLNHHHQQQQQQEQEQDKQYLQKTLATSSTSTTTVTTVVVTPIRPKSSSSSSSNCNIISLNNKQNITLNLSASPLPCSSPSPSALASPSLPLCVSPLSPSTSSSLQNNHPSNNHFDLIKPEQNCEFVHRRNSINRSSLTSSSSTSTFTTTKQSLNSNHSNHSKTFSTSPSSTTSIPTNPPPSLMKTMNAVPVPVPVPVPASMSHYKQSSVPVSSTSMPIASNALNTIIPTKSNFGVSNLSNNPKPNDNNQNPPTETSSVKNLACPVITAKPSITPRPASLSGSTRIARRSSVNAAKPPPPVRRSSSVTPSHNSTAGQTQDHDKTCTNNLVQQKQNSLNNSTESLPPPPAFLLERRQPNSSPASPPSTTMPSSSLKVAETVKALSALRHQPASPSALRRLQQQNQQQNQQPQTNYQSSPTNELYCTTTYSSENDFELHGETPDYDAYYNTYVEVKSAATISNAFSNFTINANQITNIYKNEQMSPQQHPQYQYQHQNQTQHQHQHDEKPIYNFNNTSPKATTATTQILTIQKTLDIEPMHPIIPSLNPNQQLQHHRFSNQKPSPDMMQYHPSSLYNTNHHNQNQHQDEEPLHNDHENSYQLQHQHQNLNQIQNHHNQHYQLDDATTEVLLRQKAFEKHQDMESLSNHNSAEIIYGCKPNASFRTSSPGIYAQPKVVTNMSSFRTTSPGPNGHHQMHQPQAQLSSSTQPKTNPNLIAQLNARLNSKQQQQQHQQQQHHHHQQQQQNINENLYGTTTSSSPSHYNHQLQQQHQHQHQLNETHYMRNNQHQQQQNYDDYGTSTNNDKSSSIRAKTKAEFLENLNAKLAKQSMSGRAFAVRNLINSKALPDPRVCHESLMDQIKRGATLKRNQKINDRSAPKIY